MKKISNYDKQWGLIHLRQWGFDKETAEYLIRDVKTYEDLQELEDTYKPRESGIIKETKKFERRAKNNSYADWKQEAMEDLRQEQFESFQRNFYNE